MRFKTSPIQAAIHLCIASCLTPTLGYANDLPTKQLEAITVSADLRDTALQDIPASVNVKTQADLQDQGALHFTDILLKTPNVNFSGESSRARHIQIRGMGERDEYTGAPNSSVGFAIDDIDFSGIGMTGGLFDVKQVEVLNGPQNTRYGQSAIGGLINIKTNDPTEYRESMVEASLGQDNLKELGIMTSGPFSSKEDAPQYRLAVFKHNSDGFRTNKTLDRTDTNAKDELTIRGKLRFFPSEATTVDVSLIHADLNNGYDMWADDNSYTTLSNHPGKDSQLSNAGSVKVTSNANSNYVFTSKTSVASSEMEKSYDYDWLETGVLPDDFYTNFKERDTFSQELRWHSTEASRLFGNTDWLIGFYGSHLEESNNTNGSKSSFNLSKLATFGQLDIAITPKITLTTGLRLEHAASEFKRGLNKFDPDENLWGGNIAYSYKYNEQHTAFASLTKGYKAGGFNADLADTANDRFTSETLYNYELGLKSKLLNDTLQTSLVVFYMDRYDAQFDGYSVETMHNVNAWSFYTENFNNAQNYGLEATFNWIASNQWNLYGSLGLIKTNVEGNAVSNNYPIVGREQAHAPNYQANLGAKYRNNGFYAQADVTAMDAFFYDNVHNFKSKPYSLINARIGYETQEYEIYTWVKNLTDEKYTVRGFEFDKSFDGVDQQFVSLGNPRQIGVTARFFF